MAVPEQTPYIEHTGNGVTTSFSLKFQCESKDHLIVLVDEIEPPIETWSLTGGNVVFTTAPAAGKKITLQRNTPFGRTTDYQSYNNSFRPPAVNKDFDWIWWKLQELGVADWILGARIDALKNYVDRKDDELKAYLMEEIRKQGVALDQLDEYYNYLMQRLAQIAVDKGWDASFVVDGNENQHQINRSTIRTVETIDDLIAIPSPFIGMQIYVKSVDANYVYNPSSNAIKISNWELQNNKIIYTSQLNISEGVDCSVTLNRVAAYLVGVGGGEIVLDSNIKATDVLLIGRNLTYNLNGFTVMGGGIGTNDLFKTARLENGVLVSNVLDELAVPNLVFDWGLKNGRIQDCNIALETNLAIDNSNTENISFSQASTSHKFRNSFYSSYRNLMSRSVSSVHYDLAVNVNANNFTNVSVVGGGKDDAGIAYKFTSPVSAVNLTNVNAESIQTGIKSAGQLSAFTIQSGYYEDSATAIDLSNGIGKYGVAINGNYFNGVDVAINLNQVFHGVVDQSNYFVHCDKWVVCTNDSTQADVHIIDQNHDTNVWSYVLPEQYEITGKRVKTHGRDIIYNASTGQLAASRPVWRGIIDQHYSGNIGVTIEGEVPFCRTTKVFDAGTTGAFDITIDTNITYNEFVMYAFKFKVQDNDGVHTFSGIFAGLDALNIVKSSGTKTIVATNNLGMIRLTISKLNHPSGFGTCTGRVHII